MRLLSAPWCTAKTIDRWLWKRRGVEVVLGDLHNIDTIREAMEGIDAAYLAYPVQAGFIDATVSFAHAGGSRRLRHRSA